MIKFVPNRIVVLLLTTPKRHDIVNCSGVLSLLVLADTVFLQNSLPFFRKTLKRRQLIFSIGWHSLQIARLMKTLGVTHTVNLPVSLSKPTWVT